MISANYSNEARQVDRMDSVFFSTEELNKAGMALLATTPGNSGNAIEDDITSLSFMNRQVRGSLKPGLQGLDLYSLSSTHWTKQMGKIGEMRQSIWEKKSLGWHYCGGIPVKIGRTVRI